MALAILEEHCGSHLTSKVAKELVVYIRRNHDHHQKSVYLDFRAHFHPAVHKVQDYLIANPEARPTQENLSERFGMSVRNLTRVFKNVTGLMVKQYATLIALDRAKLLLQNPENTVNAVALQCGFHAARHLRQLWRNHFGTTPREG